MGARREPVHRFATVRRECSPNCFMRVIGGNQLTAERPDQYGLIETVQETAGLASVFQQRVDLQECILYTSNDLKLFIMRRQRNLKCLDIL